MAVGLSKTDVWRAVWVWDYMDLDELSAQRIPVFLSLPLSGKTVAIPSRIAHNIGTAR
jgi:hypothetical protein